MIITPLQIRFNDMDAMGRVNNASYSSYLELGRLDFCKKYLQITEVKDIPFVLVRVEMDIRNSLVPGDTAEVHTHVSRIGQTSWEFSAQIQNTENSLIYVEAKTTQVYFNYHQNRKENIPPEFRFFLEEERIKNS
ncbi:MAG: thioesterase family protein [Spirochaetota bacterium]